VKGFVKAGFADVYYFLGGFSKETKFAIKKDDCLKNSFI
jgi:hypothetical protein